MKTTTSVDPSQAVVDIFCFTFFFFFFFAMDFGLLSSRSFSTSFQTSACRFERAREKGRPTKWLPPPPQLTTPTSEPRSRPA